MLLIAFLLFAANPPGQAEGYERHDGFVPFRWSAREGKLLLEVTPQNRELLYGVGLAGGAGTLDVSLDRGQLGDLGVCRFERVGPRMLLRQLQTSHRSGAADAESRRAVSESFPSSILAALPIVGEEGELVVVDATEFLLRDTVVLRLLHGARQGDWKQDVARSALDFERSGAFPRNTEIEASLTFTSEAPPAEIASVLPDGRTMSLLLHHTFLKLPEPGYVPRVVDPRIGFFPQFHKDHAATITEPLERYLVPRWRLRKKDPTAAVSEPEQPIIYYLDRGMPEPERQAVREAALWWNHAFEEAGFRNAFVVRDLPEGATFLDARYSGIEWIHRAERAWSVGDHQADPRTGEILHAVARIDSDRRRTTSRIWENMKLPPARGCTAADAPDAGWLAGGDPSLDESALVLARLRYLAAHEVGHTLGLAHNWAATTFGWGSVMDYLAPHVEVKDGHLDLSDAYPTDVGSYDRLAIHWGYTTEEDPKRLDQIVRDGYARGIVYPLDSDPRWAEYDWGPDPIAWLATTQRVRRVLLERFGPAQLEPGRPVYDLQARFNMAYLYHRFAIQTAQQYVGGQFQTNALAGDGQTPVAWVPAAQQQAAFDALLKALSPEELDIPDRILQALVPEPSATRPTRERFVSEGGAAFSPLSAARILTELIVRPLLDPQRAARLTLASGPQAVTLHHAIGRLVEVTWIAPMPASARHAALRRIAQRVVLDELMALAARADASPEARGTALLHLEDLQGTMRLRRATTPADAAHMSLAQRDLREFLERPEVRGARPAPLPPPPGRPIGQ
jgi:hypothetical protein